MKDRIVDTANYCARKFLQPWKFLEANTDKNYNNYFVNYCMKKASTVLKNEHYPHTEKKERIKSIFTVFPSCLACVLGIFMDLLTVAMMNPLRSSKAIRGRIDCKIVNAKTREYTRLRFALILSI